MKINRKKLIVLILGFSIVIAGFWGGRTLFRFYIVQWRQAHSVQFIFLSLFDYAYDNSGLFPDCEEDLIEAGRLRMIIVDGEVVYEMSESNGPWIPVHDFAVFAIRYGFFVEEARLQGKELVDAKTGVPLVLVDGPRKWPLPIFYRDLSVHLYKAMLEYQEALDDMTSQNSDASSSP